MTKILVLEGLDYAGKTETINQLRQALSAEGWEMTLLREPGSSEVGTNLKAMLVDPELEMDEKTRLLLLFSSRNEMVSRYLTDVPINDDKKIIIIDRYIASTFAYTDRRYWNFLWGLKTLVSPPAPDLTVYLELDRETFLERMEFACRTVKADGIESKVMKDFSAYRLRYDDYFMRADNGEFLRLSAKSTIDSHVFRILTAIGRLP